MKGPYPEIQGGGSLLLAWQVRTKRILVVGGGEVSLFPFRAFPLLPTASQRGIDH
jgi:siroheme synthase (precorrin-2 oxidase/ferrochelatase)